MKKLKGIVTAVSLGHEDDEYCMHEAKSLRAELDGLVGDRHRAFSRETWAGDDKQPEGTIRRNERLWSAMSHEEIVSIEKSMDLKDALSAANLSVNIVIQGIPHFSMLPKGTTMRFSSGAELLVEEYNPPCLDMGQKLADILATNSGEPLQASAFTRAAAYTRGLVGVVEVAGHINIGDEVIVSVYRPPFWYARQHSPYL